MLEAPEGWLICDGTEISRSTYSALFKAIGTNFGSGDGTTSFNLPDLRGEFIRGIDLDRGVDEGREIGSNQLATLQLIDAVTLGSGCLYSDKSGNPSSDKQIARSDMQADIINEEDYSKNLRAVYGSSPLGPYEIGKNNEYGILGGTRPRNVALLACIKY